MALRRPKTTERPPDPFGIDQVQRRTALAGATAIVDMGSESSWRTWKFGNADWQAEGWRLYDIVPEHHFLTGRIGDSVAQARLYVTEVDDTGEETGEVQDERISRLAAVPLGTGSQRDDNLRLAGIDLAVGGECWIIGEGAAVAPETAEGAWFVVTGAALSRLGGQVTVRRPRTRGGAKLILRDGVDILIRCWRPHPNDTDQADSFTRSAIVPLREVELLTKREFAELDSRLTGAGILFLPEGIDFPRAETDPPGMAGFMAYIQRAAAASMADQGRASSMVPIIASLPDHLLEHLDKIKPLTFWSELSAEITPMKEKAIERLAASAEIPGEVLTGIGDANHWPCDEMTEIYTRDGWITYEGLHAGVEVLALDIETGLSSFQTIDGVRVEHVTDRPMISVEGHYHSSLTTPDHRWPVERGGALEWARTQDFLSNPKNYGPSKLRRSMLLGTPNRQVPTESKLTDALTRLLAWCATDADVIPVSRGSRLRIRQRNVGNFPSIESALQDVDHVRYVDKSAEVNEWILSREATEALDAYGIRSGTRWYLSRDAVGMLTEAQLHLLLETSVQANGHKRTLFSVDESRMDAFEHAAILLGHRVSRGRRNQQTGFGDTPVAWLSWGGRTRFAPRPDLHVEEVNYTGVIFCPKVPIGRSFLARRNGKVFFTGNTAWLISDEGIRWIRGYLGLIADALTRGFLRRALEAMGVPNPDRYAFAFDTSALAAKPNRLDEAIQLHDRFLISDKEVVKAGAFDPEQMPGTTERAAQILLKLVQTQPDLILDPAVQAALGLPQVQSVGLPPTSDQNADGDPAEDDEGTSDDGPPNGGEVEAPDETRAITAALDARILELTATRVTAPPSPEVVFNASAKLMVMRALELAGGRLTTPQERRGRWVDVPRHELHHHVGPIPPDKAARVTEGAWNHVALVASDLGVNADDLQTLLGGYVNELLTRGIRHHDDLLYAALTIANQGRGLVTA